MTTFISENIAGTNVNLPADLPAPKSRKALEKGVAAKQAKQKAWSDREKADDLRLKLEAAIIQDNAALLDADPSAVLPEKKDSKLIGEARSLVDARQRNLTAYVEAERRAAISLRESILDELPILSHASLTASDTALAILAAALEDAEAARDALLSSLGVARMCRGLEDDPGAPLSVQYKAYGYTFSMSAAIDGLQDTLSRAFAELEELRGAAKPDTGKKTRAPRKAASAAPAVAPTPPQTVPAALGDLSIGQDDD